MPIEGCFAEKPSFNSYGFSTQNTYAFAYI